jgi:hypothetical protein
LALALLLSGYSKPSCQKIYPTITIGGSLSLAKCEGGDEAMAATSGITVPVFQHIEIDDAHIRFYLFSASVTALLDERQFSFLQFDRTFYKGSAPQTGSFSAGKNIWITKVVTSVFEDKTTIHGPTLRTSGFVCY